ncbi:MAG TPA: efflux RND transporter permease subunit, partial [Candidatus Eisenbacteria bacterium]
YDSSEYIRESVSEVGETLMIAVGLVVLVILFFLRSFRATIIPTLAIPTSIIGTFAVAYFLGFTINILTLLALVLAIGLVVDDAIVVLENIYRHMEMGKSRWRAAIDGSHEIGFAVISTTIALVAVFVPVAFLQGSVGRLFNEFGTCVAASVAISGIVALTFTPMLSSRILAPHSAPKSGIGKALDAFFRGMDSAYAATINFAMRNRLAVLVVALLLMIGSVFVFRMLPRELVPTEDRGTAFGIVLAPEGATLEYTDRYMRQAEAILLNVPEREGLFTATGLGFGGVGRVTNGFIFLNLKDRKDREKSQQQIVQELFPQMLGIPGVLAFLINPPSLGGGFSSSPVEYILLGDSYEQLQGGIRAMMAEGQKLGYLINMDSDLRLNKPELDIDIDRERAAQLGVSVTDIGGTLETLLGGRAVTNFKRGSKQYDVIVQMKPSDRATPDKIEQVYVKGPNGMVQLANVVQVRESVTPKELNHFNRVRAATITANLAPGVTLGKALDDLDKIARTSLPPGIKTDLGGQSREFRESSNRLYFMFFLAIGFIFLVLAAQFESFIHPLTILLSVPLAVVGAIFSLFVFGQSLNIYSQIGLIMLVGLVTKNAILIVEFANQLRLRGEGVVQATVEASRIRLRPILMTSFATIFGILPIAIGIGAGGEARRPLGIAIVGGLVFSTMLTLVVVPVVYTLMARFTRLKRIEDDEDAPAGQPASAGHPSPAHARQ